MLGRAIVLISSAATLKSDTSFVFFPQCFIKKMRMYTYVTECQARAREREKSNQQTKESVHQ